MLARTRGQPTSVYPRPRHSRNRERRAVGITALSHRMIGKLLDEVHSTAAEIGFPIRAIQKADEDDRCSTPRVLATDRNGEVRDALASGNIRLGAGTAWLALVDRDEALDHALARRRKSSGS